MTNVIRTVFTKFYQNRSGFVEEMTKTFWCACSVHSIDYHILYECRHYRLFYRKLQSKLTISNIYENLADADYDTFIIEQAIIGWLSL